MKKAAVARDTAAIPAKIFVNLGLCSIFLIRSESAILDNSPFVDVEVSGPVVDGERAGHGLRPLRAGAPLAGPAVG